MSFIILLFGHGDVGTLYRISVTSSKPAFACNLEIIRFTKRPASFGGGVADLVTAFYYAVIWGRAVVVTVGFGEEALQFGMAAGRLVSGRIRS